MSSCSVASSAQLVSLCSCTSVINDLLLLALVLFMGCCVGGAIAVLYLDWAAENERYRFGDYTFKRYEDGKVTQVVPMTAEQRAAVDKVFADKVFDDMDAVFRK